MRSACSCQRCTCFGAFLDTPGDLDSVSSSGMSPDLGEEWSSMWESEEEPLSESGSASTTRSHEHSVGNEALRIIGAFGSGERMALFLEDWELAKVALST